MFKLYIEIKTSNITVLDAHLFEINFVAFVANCFNRIFVDTLFMLIMTRDSLDMQLYGFLRSLLLSIFRNKFNNDLVWFEIQNYICGNTMINHLLKETFGFSRGWKNGSMVTEMNTVKTFPKFKFDFSDQRIIIIVKFIYQMWTKKIKEESTYEVSKVKSCRFAITRIEKQFYIFCVVGGYIGCH